jgi:hypothetical protein
MMRPTTKPKRQQWRQQRQRLARWRLAVAAVGSRRSRQEVSRRDGWRLIPTTLLWALLLLVVVGAAARLL